MFDKDSRYVDLPTRERTEPDGRTVTYVRRRLIPAATSYLSAAPHGVTDSDRLDNITHRYLGLPTAFWQVADANSAMHPGELDRRPGTTLVIPIPGHTSKSL